MSTSFHPGAQRAGEAIADRCAFELADAMRRRPPPRRFPGRHAALRRAPRRDRGCFPSRANPFRVGPPRMSPGRTPTSMNRSSRPIRAIAALFSLLAFAAFAPGAAFADEHDEDEDHGDYGRPGIYLGLNAVAGLNVDRRGPGDEVSGGGGLNARFGSRENELLAWEFQFEWVAFDQIDYGAWAYGVNAKFFFSEDRIQPYVVIGAGGMTRKDETGSATDWGFRLGGGGDYYLSEHWALNTEFVYMVGVGGVLERDYASFSVGASTASEPRRSRGRSPTRFQLHPARIARVECVDSSHPLPWRRHATHTAHLVLRRLCSLPARHRLPWRAVEQRTLAHRHRETSRRLLPGHRVDRPGRDACDRVWHGHAQRAAEAGRGVLPRRARQRRQVHLRCGNGLDAERTRCSGRSRTTSSTRSSSGICTPTTSATSTRSGWAGS